ncbi:MAG: histidine kinase [Xanthobacteraceae bacterium]|nr:histidine kinase [Xanthobacteraceae bacterium]
MPSAPALPKRRRAVCWCALPVQRKREELTLRRLLWILLIGVGVAAALFVAQNPAMLARLSAPEFASLAIKIVVLVVVSGVVMMMFRENFGRAVVSALIWVGIGLVLVVGYTYRFELRDVAGRVRAELTPGHANTSGRTVEVARGNSGNFAVETRINGAKVPMVLDTGASSVVLSYEAAKAAGLPLEVIAYTVNVDTANGRTRAAAVTLDRVAVGGLVERSVTALVAQPGQLKVSLLGMSFLNRLESWEVRGEKLMMRGYP